MHEKNFALTVPAENAGATHPATGQFVQVPVELIKTSEISPAALKLYMLLLAYCGSDASAFPSQARLAGDMALSDRRIRGLMEELAETGLVTVRNRPGTSNLYRPLVRVSAGGAEENFRNDRKKISANLHASDTKHVCESIPPTQAREVIIPLPEIDNVPDQTENFELEQILCQTGISTQIAKELVTIIRKNNRDKVYLESVVKAAGERTVNNPPGFIRFMIIRNAEPMVVEKAKPVRSGKKPAHSSPLDFTKYTSGKYAFLTGKVKTEVPAIQEEVPADFPATGDFDQSKENQARRQWLTIRKRLELTGKFQNAALQHARLRPASSGNYRVEFPAWLRFDHSQEELIRLELNKVADGILQI